MKNHYRVVHCGLLSPGVFILANLLVVEPLVYSRYDYLLDVRSSGLEFTELRALARNCCAEKSITCGSFEEIEIALDGTKWGWQENLRMPVSSGGSECTS